jgi:serine/threonine protein phosphatase 1
MKASFRTIAIGDIHGCGKALAALIDAIRPDREDTVVCLGDFVDRGPDSRGVVDQLISLAGRCRLVPLLGDHEDMMINALTATPALRKWLSCDGAETLRSYSWRPGSERRALVDWIPAAHRKFLQSCRPYHETQTHLFVHAGFVPDLPMDQQPIQALLWRVTDASTATGHQSGKVAVVGHTAQLSGEVLNLGFLVCIDTNCARGGWLTAMEVYTGRMWQANCAGRLRV